MSNRKEEILGAIAEILGDNVAGDEMEGDEVEGEEMDGDEVAGDEILGALFRRGKKKKRSRAAIINARLAQQGTIVKNHGYARGYNQPLGFGPVSVPGLATQVINANPQVLFTPTRLVCTGADVDSFSITSIKIGRQEQLVASDGGGVPANAYPPTFTGDNFRFNTAEPGKLVSMTVQNTNAAPKVFSAMMQGPVAD